MFKFREIDFPFNISNNCRYLNFITIDCIKICSPKFYFGLIWISAETWKFIIDLFRTFNRNNFHKIRKVPKINHINK